MQIIEYDSRHLESILKELQNETLIYGNGKEYESLLSPCVVTLSQLDCEQINGDFESLWKFYNTWTNLYSELKQANEEHWLVKLSRNGLTAREIEIQDETIATNLIPRYGRIDYIRLGENRKVAEIQWRSGGPGLIVGISEVISREVKKVTNLKFAEFNFANEIAKVFFVPELKNANEPYVIVNDVSSSLSGGEKYFIKHHSFKDFKFIPIVRDFLLESISIENNRIACRIGATKHRVSFIHGYDLIKLLPEVILEKLVHEVHQKRIWIESPLNFIYKQKWGMALPFMDEFATYFDDRIRSILCPTILLNLEQPNFSFLSKYISHPNANLLTTVKSVLELADLPRGLRENLVLKCGSGEGKYHTKSRGVFRLDGTKQHLMLNINLAVGRMKQFNEPWILQPYINQKTDIPFVIPSSLDQPYREKAHSRYLIFGSKLSSDESPKMIGGLANYGKYWKVNGRSNSMKSSFREWGSSFVPLVKVIN